MKLPGEQPAFPATDPEDAGEPEPLPRLATVRTAAADEVISSHAGTPREPALHRRSEVAIPARDPVERRPMGPLNDRGRLLAEPV